MTVQDLKKSFIFNASLGSKELFHSNFWSWLIEQDKTIASRIFGFHLFDANEVQVKREVGSKSDKIDILLEELEHRYIIENKIKSIPNRLQLERYTDLVNRHGIFLEGVLTGIKEPNFELPNNWRFLSYATIAENLRNYIQQIDIFHDLQSYKPVIQEYIDVIMSINDHLNRRLNETDFELDFSAGNLAEIRFDDVYKKFKASEFIKYFKNFHEHRITDAEGLEEFDFTVKQDYNHKSATISFEITNRLNNVSIGIQIEGNQYRYFVRTSHDTPHIQTFQLYSVLGWFDINFNRYNHQMIHGHSTIMNGSGNSQFNLYRNVRENYKFIYQYSSIQISTYDYLAIRISDDLVRAIGILR